MNEPRQTHQRDSAETVQIRAEWGAELEAAPIHFSDQVIASFRGEYFIVSFGQVAQPQFLPGDDEAIEALRARGTLPIRTQFRTAVPVSDFAEFLAGMLKVAKAQGVTLPRTEEQDGDFD